MKKCVVEPTKVYNVTKDSSDGKITKGCRIDVFEDGSLRVMGNGKIEVYEQDELSMDFEANENDNYDYINNGITEEWLEKGSYTKEVVDIDDELKYDNN